MTGRSSPPVASTTTPRTFSALRRRASAARPSTPLATRTGVPVTAATSKYFLQISTNPRAGCGHRVPALSAALSLATVRADDRRGRDRATRRLAPVVGCELRSREASAPRGDRFTDTVPESRETRLGQASLDPTYTGTAVRFCLTAA